MSAVFSAVFLIVHKRVNRNCVPAVKKRWATPSLTFFRCSTKTHFRYWLPDGFNHHFWLGSILSRISAKQKSKPLIPAKPAGKLPCQPMKTE
jgi:hypothetical protein